MTMNSISSSHSTSINSRRRIYISGVVIRLLIALLISWVIVMFFVTGAVSH